MMARMLASAVLGCTLASALFPAPAQALSCRCGVSGTRDDGTLITPYSVSSFAAVVRVESVEPFGGVRALATVEEVFKGPEDAAEVILVGDSPGHCASPLSAGRDYLVFARRAKSDDEAYRTGFCLGQKLLESLGSVERAPRLAQLLLGGGARDHAVAHLRGEAAKADDERTREELLRRARVFEEMPAQVTRAATDASEGRFQRAVQNLDERLDTLGRRFSWRYGLDGETIEGVRENLCPAAKRALDTGRHSEAMRLSVWCRSLTGDHRLAAPVIDELEERAAQLEEEAKSLVETDTEAALRKWREALSITADNSLIHRRILRRHPDLRE